MKIALTMIVKGTQEEFSSIQRAVQSIIHHVDKAFITITGKEEDTKECEKWLVDLGVEVSRGDFSYTIPQEMVDWLTEYFKATPHSKVGDKIFIFDNARNYSLQQIPPEYDFFIWMDKDDVFRNGHLLHQVAETASTKGIEAVYFNYLYQVETTPEGEIKNILIQHLRERLMRNNGAYKWIAPIHETLIEQRPTVKTDNYDCDIVHLSTMEDRFASLERNLRNLEFSIYQTKGKDPRPIYYLAKALYDLNTEENNERAKTLIFQYLQGEDPSGWKEERSQAWGYLSDIYRRQNQFNNSIKSCMNALIEHPKDPATFVNLALACASKNEWDNALFWIKIAATIPQEKTTLVINPKDMQAKTLDIIYNACVQMNKVDEAWAAAQKLVAIFPDEKIFADRFMWIDSLRQQRDVTRDIMKLADVLKRTGETPKIKALLQAIPKAIEDNPFMVNLYQQNNPPTYFGKKDITIYCGPGFTNWSPKKLEDPGESFVGGSEEAVILMSQALQKQGWNVTVYADPGLDEGKHDGVNWLPYYKFNRLDNFNILIGWRDVRFFETKFNAKKKYLWCHDIQSGIEYTEQRVANVDKVFFLSKWHYENDVQLQKNLPIEKAFFTTNGVTV